MILALALMLPTIAIAEGKMREQLAAGIVYKRSVELQRKTFAKMWPKIEQTMQQYMSTHGSK